MKKYNIGIICSLTLILFLATACATGEGALQLSKGKQHTTKEAGGLNTAEAQVQVFINDVDDMVLQNTEEYASNVNSIVNRNLEEFISRLSYTAVEQCDSNFQNKIQDIKDEINIVIETQLEEASTEFINRNSMEIVSESKDFESNIQDALTQVSEDKLQPFSGRKALT